MTAAAFRGTPSMVVPPTQNMAPVLEFNCLYTHDARKKQKRWQDGFLRFHTFNKRIMVYDVPRNFIGDTHWAGTDAVQDGDELTLEQSGVVVEVGESIGQTETDLTELRKSKNRRPTATEQSGMPAKATQLQTPRVQPDSRMVARANVQQKHKSLHLLLGTPKGPIGKAQLPTRSPFEERHANVENKNWQDGRPPKRSRIGSAPAWNIQRTTTTAKPVKPQDAPLWTPMADAGKRKMKASLPTGQQMLATKEVIDLSDDASQQSGLLPGFSDGLLDHSSPLPKRKRAATSSTLGQSSPPAFQVQQVLPTLTAVKSKPQASAKRSRANEVQRSTGERLRSSAVHERPRQNRQGLRVGSPTDGAEQRPIESLGGELQTPTSSETGHIPRLQSTGPRNRTLLCQDQLRKTSKKLTSAIIDDATVSTIHQVVGMQRDDRPLTTREKFEARLARIEAKKRTAKKNTLVHSEKASVRSCPTNSKVATQFDSEGDLPDGPSMTVGEQEVEQLRQLQTTHETSATELARLDQLMLPPAARRLKPVAFSKSIPPEPPAVGPPPTREDRSLRRVVSDSTIAQPSNPKRVPGAPVRYTPSPTRRSHESTPVPRAGSRKAMPVPAAAPESAGTGKVTRPAPDKSAYKKKGPLQKSVSLNLTSNGTSTVILSKPFQAPGRAAAANKTPEPELPQDLGPWSREAFDLFNWRPPGWDEDNWREGAAASGGTMGTSSSHE